LTDQQIEKYASGDPGLSVSIEGHIAKCEQCRARVLEHGREKVGVLEDGPGSELATPDCPDEEILQEIAARVSPPETSEHWLEHVSHCDHCAPLLKIYLDAVEDDIPVDAVEDDIPVPVPALRSNRWRDFIFSLKSVLQSFRGLPLGPKIAWASGLGVVLLTLVVAGPPLVSAFRLHRAENTLAAAFQESRPSGMRVTWGPFAEVDKRRGRKPLPITDLPTLVEAAAIAAREKDSPDARWIRYRGRVKLLADDPEASQVLMAASERGLNDASTKIDLAVAYFQREVQAGGTEAGQKSGANLGQSLELLNKVLSDPKLSLPEQEVALFDLAIVYERMLFWDQAALTWERYLRLDPAGQWHDEAARHLEKTKSNLPPPKPQGYREPGYFLRSVDDPTVQASLEEYQDIALRTWVLDAATHPDSDASRALHSLANLLEERHGDSWMKEFLLALGPGDSPGVEALSAAVGNNRQGHYTNAKRHAQEAIAFFRLKNRAAVLRAQFEEIYANQRLLEGPTCLGGAESLAGQAARTSYRWLQVQTALEQAVCDNFAIRFNDAQKKLESGHQSAIDAKFIVLPLRAQALDAAIWIPHDCNTTWQKVQSGLEQYWHGPGFPLRLYEFYSAEKQCLEKDHLWNAAKALELGMITLLEKEFQASDKNVILEFTAHRTLEQILKEVDDTDAAEAQALVAIRLLDHVDRAIAGKFEIPIKLELADLQLARGDSEAALATIQEAENHLRDTHDRRIRLGLLRVRGDIQLARQQIAQAADDYKAALLIAEAGLRRLESHRERRQWAGETGDVYRGLVEVLLDQKNDQEAMLLWQWYQARPFEADGRSEEGNLDPQWSDIERTVLRQPLPSISDKRLVYASTRRRLIIWKIGNAGIQAVWVPEKREDLERTIFQYLQKCANQSPSLSVGSPDEDGSELFSVLLKPVMADLQGSDTVTVTLDQALTKLPLEALRSPEGWYFGEKYAVVYSPGYIRENDLRKPVQQPPREGLLLNAFDSQSEQSEIQKLFPSIIVKYDEGMATAELPPLLERSEMFVFIGHGESGTLIRNGKKPLKAQDFRRESLGRLQLVVLAACSTGSPGGSFNDSSSDSILDTGNLVNAFQAGGAPSIVASLWDVESEATEDLMKRFFTHLSNAESVPHALSQARKEMIRDGRHSHPYYWAGFILNGRAI
jgi:CHAT domain-containing protein